MSIINGSNQYHVTTKVSEDERTAAYKYGVNIGGGRFWFTAQAYQQFCKETERMNEGEKHEESIERN